MRREKLVLEERMDRGGTEDVLFEGVKKLEFEYWNSERKQWEDEWDTRRAEQEVHPAHAGEDHHHRRSTRPARKSRYTTQTRIMLNTELPRFQ